MSRNAMQRRAGSPSERRTVPDMRGVLREGFLGGLLAAALIAAAHLVHDVAIGEPLRTPAILGALLFDGLDAAHRAPVTGLRVLQFAIVHVLTWLTLGGLTAYLVSLVESFPKLWHLVFGVVFFAWASLLYLAGAFSVPGLPPLHLWLGVLLGAATLVVFLARRHPAILRRLDRVTITETTKRDLAMALDREYASRALYRELLRAIPEDATATRLARAAETRVDAMLRLLALLDIPAAEAPPPAEPVAAGAAAEVCRSAVRLEEEKIALYDHFLVSVDEPGVHALLLDLAAEAQDQLLPELRACLAGQRGRETAIEFSAG